MTSRDRFRGCVLGLALGDAMGAPHEGGVLERLVWRLIGRTRSGERRWTDDTQMSLDLAESLFAKGTLDVDDLAVRFATSYRWSRGYGPGTAKVLRRIRRGIPWREAGRAVHPDGSYGNGGAMRAPVVSLYCASRPDDLVEAARDSATVTHAHPLGVEGAVLIAAAVYRALHSHDPEEILEFASKHCQQGPFVSRLTVATDWIRTGQSPQPKEVARSLGRGVPAAESCVTAVYVGLRFLSLSYSDMLDFTVECGGDTDTVGAMSGAIWGAANGAAQLPDRPLNSLEQRERLEEVADAMYDAFAGNDGENIQ